MFINTASILFAFTRQEAHWVLTAWLANLLFMPMLFAEFGYTRILGLSHIVFWTPLLVYLWRRRAGIELRSISGAYLWALFASNGLSLVIDYIDLARYLAGDGALT
jgi:hypothetical protein